MTNRISEHKGPLTLKPVCGESVLESLEQEAIALLDALTAENIPGDWRPSRPVATYRLLRETLIRTPGFLRTFRRSFLAASLGSLNFPDYPLPREWFLSWGSQLPLRQYLSGIRKLLRQHLWLRRHVRYGLSELDDPLAGSPSTFNIPKSFTDWCKWGFRIGKPEVYHITEVQMRMMYYRARISEAWGVEYGPILEVGGGHGALAGELLRHVSTPVYFLVELPDALPLAYFYLRVCFDGPIQVIYRCKDEVDPSARIVLLAPWKLPDVECEIDLLVNTASFQHMDRTNLDFYFGQVDRLKVKRMYLVNRNVKRDPTDVIIDNYPIPSRFRVVNDAPWVYGFAKPWVRERTYEALSVGVQL